MITATKSGKRSSSDGNALWGGHVKTERVISSIRHGLPMSAFVALGEKLDMSNAELAQAVGIPQRTLTRRKKDGRFLPGESDRLWRIGYLLERATALLGTEERAREWLKTPKKSLGGKSPVEYADTEPGTREVEDLLGRLEYGVFS